MAASSGKKSSRSKKSRSSSARSSKSSKSSLWRQIKTIGISIIVVYWLASCFTFGVSDFEIFDEGHWVTAKARAEKVAAFTTEHPEAFIMDVWGFGDRTKINPVIAGADSGVRVWCINSHEVTKTAVEAAQKLCKTTKSGPTTIAIYGGNFANVDFSTNTLGSSSLELTVQQWGKNKYKGLEKMFAGFHTVEFADSAGVPDLSQATSIERVFEYVESIIGDLNKWDVSHIENFSSAFHDSQFNGDISKWDTRNATTMRDMFMSAFYFNGDISRWNTARVTDMRSMFFQAASFDRNLSQWDIAQLKLAYDMFDESGLSPKNFTATLVAGPRGSRDNMFTWAPGRFIIVGIGRLVCRSYRKPMVGQFQTRAQQLIVIRSGSKWWIRMRFKIPLNCPHLCCSRSIKNCKSRPVNARCMTKRTWYWNAPSMRRVRILFGWRIRKLGKSLRIFM